MKTQTILILLAVVALSFGVYWFVIRKRMTVASVAPISARNPDPTPINITLPSNNNPVAVPPRQSNLDKALSIVNTGVSLYNQYNKAN